MSQLTDSLGRLFDPQKFKNAQDKLGRWINARAGRKPAKKSPAPQPPAQSPTPAMPEKTLFPEPDPAPAVETPPPAAAAAPEPAPAPDFSDIDRAAGAAPSPESLESDLETASAEIAKGSTPTAETILGIIQTILVLIGEEEGILTESEKILIRPSLHRVLKKYNVGADVLPAEVELIIALAGLVVSRLKKPKTARVAAKIRGWIVNLWAGRKGREIQRIVTREASA